MPTRYSDLLWAAMLVGLTLTPAAAQYQTHLDPRATYLLHPAVPVSSPLVVPLSTMGAQPGNCLRLVISGTFLCRGPSDPTCVTSSAGAVFSSTSVVLGPTERYRVPGAIAAVPTVMTGANCGPNGSGLTDIPEDFRMDTLASMTVKVPAGAAFLVVGSPDCYNSDNVDSDGDFMLTATVLGCAADFNCSGTASVQDVFDFLGAYFTGHAWADFNGSGAVTVQDIFDYLAAYFAGCG